MAKLQLISPVALPLVVPPVIKIKNSIPCHADQSKMTPFSAVAPARFLAVSSRVQVYEISLGTIYEEEIYISSSSTTTTNTITTTTKEDDDFVETMAFKSSSPVTKCFLEVQQSFISSASKFNRNNFQCAN